MARYANGRGMHSFLEDRFIATLLPWKLANCDGHRIVLTQRGALVARIAGALGGLFSEK
jgi:hypothetical protein